MDQLAEEVKWLDEDLKRVEVSALWIPAHFFLHRTDIINICKRNAIKVNWSQV